MEVETVARFGGPQTITAAPGERGDPGADEVLLEVEACGICGTDLHFYSGRWPQPTVIPGHEIAGVVRTVGAGVTAWKPGDQVVVEPTIGCGHCRFCQAGDLSLCADFQFMSIHRDGGFATSVLVPTSCLHLIPPGMDFHTAALAEPLAVAVHACRAAGIKPGDTVVVCGAGSIGLLVIAAALESGAAKVISSARHPHQQAAAARLGAVASAPDELESAVREEAGLEGADAAVETVGGAGQTVGQAIGVVRSGCTVALAGGFTRPTSILLARVVSREIRLVGASFYSRSGSPTDFELALDILNRRGSALQELVTHRYPLASVDEAFRTAADKGSGAIKVQVDCPSAARSSG